MSDYKPAGEFIEAKHVDIAPKYFDPTLSTGSSEAWAYYHQMLDALIKPMPEGPRTLCLATALYLSDDEKVYEFKLREGVKFHNGDTMTAVDVKYSFERYSGIYSNDLHEKVERVEIVDDYTIRFHLKDPWPGFLAMYTDTCFSGANFIVPAAYVERVGDEGFLLHPIGCGPYKFVSFDKDGLVLEAFEDYWRKVPHIKTIKSRSITEGSTRLAALVTDEVDMGRSLRGDLYYAAMKEPNVTVYPSSSLSMWYLELTAQWDPNSPWSDVRVRKAATLALDRPTLRDAAQPGGNLSSTIIPPSIPGTISVERKADPYDPEKAKELLAEAGYPNGFYGGGLYGTDSKIPLMELIASYWSKVGIEIDLKILERAAFYAAKEDLSMKGDIVLGGTAGPDLFGRLASTMTNVYGHYADVDDLWAKIEVSQDFEGRAVLMRQFEELVTDKYIYVPLTQVCSAIGVGPRVKYAALDISIISWASPWEDVELYPDARTR
ncbi:ABC transporter substrate-binding protein [Chloroflexota bacterium]